MGRFKSLLLILLTVSVSLVATDVVFTCGFKAVNGYNLLKPAYEFRQDSPIYHHDLIPCSSGLSDTWGASRYAFTTNSLGFRDQYDRTIDLKGSYRRVLVIGDSFTEGVGVRYEDSFVGRADNITKGRIEILNAGVASYSPIIYWRKVKYLIEDVGLQFDHLVVYLDISDIEDEAKSYKLSAANTVVDKSSDDVLIKPIVPTAAVEQCTNLAKHTLEDLLWNYTTLLYFAFDYDRQMKLIQSRKSDAVSYSDEQLLGMAVHQDRPKWTVSDELMLDFGTRGLAQSALYMERLGDLLRSYGIKLTLAVYPWPTQVWYRDKESVQVTYWREWAIAHEVDFISHFSDFVLGGSEQDRVDFIWEHYIWGDVHLNENGHQLIAKRLIEYLGESRSFQ